MQTKTKSDDAWLIDFPSLKRNTMTNSTQFSDWLCIVQSTQDESSSLDNLIPFIYLERESEGHMAYFNLIPGIKFSDLCLRVARVDGKHFDDDKRRLYNSIRVYVASYKLSCCDKHKKKKDGYVAWKDLVEH